MLHHQRPSRAQKPTSVCWRRLGPGPVPGCPAPRSASTALRGSRASDVASVRPVFVLLWDGPGGEGMKSDPAPRSCTIAGLAGR